MSTRQERLQTARKEKNRQYKHKEIYKYIYKIPKDISSNTPPKLEHINCMLQAWNI